MTLTVNGVPGDREAGRPRPRTLRVEDVTQALIDTFAAVSGDGQWIHTDVERAAEGPFGRTIARLHGAQLADMPWWRSSSRSPAWAWPSTTV